MIVGGIFIVTSLQSLNYTNIVIGVIIAGAAFILIGRGLSKGRERGRNTVAIDLIAVVLIATFFLTMLVGDLFGLIGRDQPTQNITQFLLVMEFGGLILTLISGGLVLNPVITTPKFNTAMLYIAANFAAFFVLNLIVPPASYKILGLSISPANPFIMVLISIPEETVFHVWLAPWLANVSRTGPLGGSFMQAIIASAYHLFVLGTQPEKLGVVFGAFFVTGFTAMQAKLASVTMTNHLVNNFISVLGRI